MIFIIVGMCVCTLFLCAFVSMYLYWIVCVILFLLDCVWMSDGNNLFSYVRRYIDHYSKVVLTFLGLIFSVH